MGGEGLSPGDEVGSYVVESCLGSGGMGDVYLVRHRGLNKRFAMKVFRRPDHERADEFAARFQLEMKTVATLDHPNIVTATDSGDLDGNPWFTMNYIQGMDGREAVTRWHPTGLPPTQVLRIMDAIAGALDYAHGQGLVHRDVKPGNIMLGANGRDYLTDFGIVKALSDPDPITTTAAHPPKTLEFASPEQQLDQPLGPRSDGYSLGATMFYLLTGRNPYDGHPLLQADRHISRPPPQPSRTNPDLPPALDAVVAKAMAKKPDERFSTCRDLATATREALRSRLAPTRPAPQPPPEPQQPPPTPAPVPWKPAGRGPWVALAIVAIVLVGGIGTWVAVRSSTSGTAGPTTSAPDSPVTSTSASLADGNTSAAGEEAAIVPLQDLLAPSPPTRSGTSSGAPVAGAPAIALGPRTCPNGVRKYSVDVGPGLQRITGTFQMSDAANSSTRTNLTVVADAVTIADETVAPRDGATVDVGVGGVRDLVIELATAGSGTCGSDDYFIFLTNAQAFR